MEWVSRIRILVSVFYYLWANLDDQNYEIVIFVSSARNATSDRELK